MNCIRHYSIFLLLVLLATPSISFAAEIAYEPLVGIPGLGGSTDINEFFNTLYAISISVAALLAVLKVIVAGVKYMLTDVVTSKSQAISDIQGALVGLIIVVGAWAILFVINPQIVGGFSSPREISDITRNERATPDAAELCNNDNVPAGIVVEEAGRAGRPVCRSDHYQVGDVLNCPGHTRVFCVPNEPDPMAVPERTISCQCDRGRSRTVTCDCTQASQLCRDRLDGTPREQTNPGGWVSVVCEQ